MAGVATIAALFAADLTIVVVGVVVVIAAVVPGVVPVTATFLARVEVAG